MYSAVEVNGIFVNSFMFHLCNTDHFYIYNVDFTYVYIPTLRELEIFGFFSKLFQNARFANDRKLPKMGINKNFRKSKYY
jgi:hypothetical protein